MTDTTISQKEGMHGRRLHDADDDQVPDDKGETSPPPSWLVWLVRIASLSLLAGLVGYMLYLCVRPTVPAQFTVEPDFASAVQRSGAWALPVDVTNASTEAVSSLMVEVAMTRASGEEVARTATLPLMGEGERILIEVVLPERPDASNTETTVLSYQSP